MYCNKSTGLTLGIGFHCPVPTLWSPTQLSLSLSVQWDLKNLVGDIGDLVGGRINLDSHFRLTLRHLPFSHKAKFLFLIDIFIYFLTSAWSYWHMSDEDENSMLTANFSWLSWVNSEVWSFWSCPFMVGSIPLQSKINGVGVRGIIKLCSPFLIG